MLLKRQERAPGHRCLVIDGETHVRVRTACMHAALVRAAGTGLVRAVIVLQAQV